MSRRASRGWLGCETCTSISEELKMNKDQVKGKAKDIAGKIQEKGGRLVGSTAAQAKGLKKQVEGKAQAQIGNLKEDVKDVSKP